MSSPLITICIPTYNHERFLQETLASVIAQSYDNFEVLVIDDCSVDGTAEIARGFALQDPRISVHVNERNLGMVANWNRCLEMAQGEFIKFVFGDDLMTSPETLQRMAEVFASDREVTLVASARNIIDEDSRIIESFVEFPDKTRIPGQELVKRCLEGIVYQHNLIGEPSVVMF